MNRQMFAKRPYRISRRHWVWGKVGIQWWDDDVWGTPVTWIRVWLPGKWWVDLKRAKQ